MPTPSPRWLRKAAQARASGRRTRDPRAEGQSGRLLTQGGARRRARPRRPGREGLPGHGRRLAIQPPHSRYEHRQGWYPQIGGGRGRHQRGATVQALSGQRGALSGQRGAAGLTAPTLHFATGSNHVHRRPNLRRSSPGSRPSSLRCGRPTLTPAPGRRSHAATVTAKERRSTEQRAPRRGLGLTISSVERSVRASVGGTFRRGKPPLRNVFVARLSEAAGAIATFGLFAVCS
jgi:hypothetical protein